MDMFEILLESGINWVDKRVKLPIKVKLSLTLAIQRWHVREGVKVPGGDD